MDCRLADPVDLDGPWESDPHPEDHHVLYMRVAADKFTELDGDLVPESVVFKNFSNGLGEAGMSTDWCRYASPHDTRMRTVKKAPDEYGVVSLPVGKVKAIPSQRIEHTPIYFAPKHDLNNRAHTDVFGPKSKDELLQIERDAVAPHGETIPPTQREIQAASVRTKQEATAIRNRFQTCAAVEILPDAPLGVGDERRENCQPS